MKIVKCDSQEELNEKVARLFIDAVENKPGIVLGLATGSSPVGVYQKLIEDHQINGTTYREVTTFNLDEYEGLSGDHPQSYRHFMNEFFFNAIDISKENTFVPSGTGNLENAIRDYENSIGQHGGIDLQLLGIGTNGHIAFNEPGTSFETTTHVIGLSEETIQDNARFFESIDDVPKRAVTMGIKSILVAKKIVLIAMGKAKAEVIQKMVNGPLTESVPATALQKHADVTVFVDREAGSLLE